MGNSQRVTLADYFGHALSSSRGRVLAAPAALSRRETLAAIQALKTTADPAIDVFEQVLEAEMHSELKPYLCGPSTIPAYISLMQKYSRGIKVNRFGPGIARLTCVNLFITL